MKLNSDYTPATVPVENLPDLPVVIPEPGELIVLRGVWNKNKVTGKLYRLTGVPSCTSIYQFVGYDPTKKLGILVVELCYRIGNEPWHYLPARVTRPISNQLVSEFVKPTRFEEDAATKAMAMMLHREEIASTGEVK